MWSERGVTLLETVFGLAVLVVITLTLLPILQQLQGNLYTKQLRFYASEVALNGAKMMQSQQISSGQMHINETEFKWQYESEQICVDFEGLKGPEQRCVQIE